MTVKTRTMKTSKFFKTTALFIALAIMTSTAGAQAAQKKAKAKKKQDQTQCCIAGKWNAPHAERTNIRA